MLPEAWISTPQVREWRELVRYRAKMVGLRTGLKTQVHAVLAKHGIQVPVSDLFGVGGRELLGHLIRDDTRFRSAYGQRVESLLVLIDGFDHEIDEVGSSISHTFRDHAGYHAIQTIDGVGPVIAAIFVAEIGDVTRFSSAAHLASWCGLTPRHRESDTTIKRGPITKQGCRLVRWAAVEAAQKLRTGWVLHQRREHLAEQRNSRKIAKVAGSSRSSTTGCATATSAASNQRHDPPHPGDPRVWREPASGHDPHHHREIVRLIASA